jgi:predicted dehydrogenase/threonine dehydrogenase-like Zn-dependent dehydrogenase
MKQLSQNLRSGKLSIDEVPAPSIQPGQVLVQTVYSLISVGTERTKIETGRKSLLGKALARPDQVRQVYQTLRQSGWKTTYAKVKTRLDARSPLGYSAAGVVSEVGSGVDEFRPGDWVACGGDNAAHAEIMAVPRNLCARVPESVNLKAAAFATLGAVAMQGIRRADLRLSEYAVVSGLGLLGQLTIQMLKAAGCIVIGYDPNPDRCQLAIQMGADCAVNEEEDLKTRLSQFTSNKGVDAVLITAATRSNRPVALAGELCRDKGRVVIVGAVGLTIPRPPYYDKELDLSLSRSYGPGRYDVDYEEKGVDYPYGFVRWTEQRNMTAFLNLVSTGKVQVEPLISHVYHLDQAEQAYGLISGAFKEPYLGVLFEYDHPPVVANKKIEVNAPGEKVSGKLVIGVIGAGSFAQSTLLPALHNNKDVLLRGVTTINPLETRDAAERFKFSYQMATPDEIFKDPEVQAVIIASRHDSHATLTIEAIRANKAVHVEKPLALNGVELEEIIQAYAQAQHSPFVMVGFNRRFAPMIQRVLKFFDKRVEPLAMNFRINAGYLPLTHWTQDPQQGGGRIIGEVCHFVDLMQYLAGAPVRQVFAQALPNEGKYNNDNVAVTLQFHDGSIGNILYIANGDTNFPKEYLEVFGEGKIAIIEDYHRLTLISRGRRKVYRMGMGDKGHQAEMEAWVNAIRTGKTEPVPFAEAVAATKATFTIHTSLADGKAVIIS